jgi:hypothetical protein
VVYGPLTTSQKKKEFLQELTFTHQLGCDFWFLCGDFNFIRKQTKTPGSTYQYKVRNKFNSFINDSQLLELYLSDRCFTWAKSSISTVKALLDRFFCSLQWNEHFTDSVVTSLPRFSSDHNPLILCTIKKRTPFIFLGLKKVGSIFLNSLISFRNDGQNIIL